MYLYFALLYIASLFNSKARKLVRGQRSTLSLLKKTAQPSQHWVWFHAASLGEFEQGRPLMERFRTLYPHKKILLTFFSPSGYEMQKDYAGADCVAYLPFATRLNARRLLSVINIDAAFFIKYEFWPSYLRALKKAGVKTYSVSSVFRRKQTFFRWWAAPYRACLKNFTCLFVQDEDSKALLAKYGIDSVVVVGDTRFDRVSEICSVEKHIPQLEYFCQDTAKVIVAGSTWDADEKLLARYVQERFDVKLVLVPHEIDPKHLHRIFQYFSGRYVRFSEATPTSLRLSKCLLVDNMGMLSQLYKYATVAYIGGGFGVGIHNIIEASVYGKPVVFGPNYKRFREAHRMIATGGGFSIGNYKELANVLDIHLADNSVAGRAAADYVQLELGATEKILSYLKF